MSIKNKAGLYHHFPPHAHDINGQFWTFEQSLYIVDFTNVYCASSFVCLLVDLHINACITYKVIKIVMIESGPSTESKNNRCIWKPFPSFFTDDMTLGFAVLF